MPVDWTLVCDHLNESYRAVRSCGAVNYAVYSGSNFWVLVIEQYLLFILLFKIVLSFTLKMKAKCVTSQDNAI